MAKLAADVYSEALFALAIEQDSVDVLAEQVKAAELAFSENPDFLGLLTHPKITREEKLSVVEQVFRGRFDDALTGLLTVIVEKGRGCEISAVFRNFLDKVREYRKIGVASVVSATELTGEQKSRIEEEWWMQASSQSLPGWREACHK